VAGLTPAEERRRNRVVHGWAFSAKADKKNPHYDEKFVKKIRRYLSGKSDTPPANYVQIDKAMR